MHISLDRVSGCFNIATKKDAETELRIAIDGDESNYVKFVKFLVDRTLNSDDDDDDDDE